MPRVALAEDELAAFRARAIAAATRLFAAQGYDAVTMRAVAAELGVSAMTPYRYFDGKEALFAGVRAEAFRRFADRLEAALATPGAPLARLRRLKEAYVAFAVAEPDAYRIMFELARPNPDDRELAAQSARAFATLHRSVADAVRAGALRGDPLTIAHLVWADTHGLVSLHLAGKLVGRSLAQLARVDHELAGFRTTRAGRPAARPTRPTRHPRRLR
ncbi:MAG TPA: TetR/AcrR family transcriptional regulator [Kofleriaceae bacterium]|nr:TetR/AcrR family transcriptional regulator [Kofleriaceae bacterium]